MPNDDILSLVGDSKIFEFNDSNKLTIYKNQVIAFAQKDTSHSTSKIYLYLKHNGTSYLERWYYKEDYKNFLKDLKLLQDHFNN